MSRDSIQTIDTRGYHPAPSRSTMRDAFCVVGNQSPLAVREGRTTRQVPANLAVFRIGTDGKLEFARTYDVDANPSAGRLLFWTGIVSLH